MKQIAIIGGGAAGFFAAITCANARPNCRVIVLEQAPQVLGKVKISGGGRCNVTHACFEPRELVNFYPRGSAELRGAFSRFQPADTVAWFAERGVELKTESDGRMFPTTDSSQTIIDCLAGAAAEAGVQVRTRSRVQHFRQMESGTWQIGVGGEPILFADAVIVATGSSAAVWEQLAALSYEIIEPVPSLFTFHIQDPRIDGLSGLSVPSATVRIMDSTIAQRGALLITHWGMSGPAILRTSAWGARHLADIGYRFSVEINWIDLRPEACREQLQAAKQSDAKRFIAAHPKFGLPTRLWQRMVAAAAINEQTRWADISKQQLQQLATELTAGVFSVTGKSTFKEEFVTAGGIALTQVNFKTMQSKLHKNLYFAGEVLDIDAVTGGFNFQAAWTTGFLAGTAAAASE